MSDRLHELAIAALDDPDAAVVLGDYVLETGWFDRRVMRVIWPFWYSRQGTTPKPKGKTRRSLVKERRGIERRAWTAGYPDEFWSRAAAPTEEWARAVWTDAELTSNRREDWLFAPSEQQQLQLGSVLLDDLSLTQ